MIRSIRKDAGFSLIELAIALTIVSLMVATSLQTFRQYNVTKERNDTSSHRDIVTQALTRFLYNYHRLPCPADPSLAPGAALAGFEQCLTGPGQTAPTYCSGKACRVPGLRDTTDDSDSTVDNVLTGSIPYATVGIPLSQAIDGYGSKFVYAVTEYLTRQGTGGTNSQSYNDQDGVIDVEAYDKASGVIGPGRNKYVQDGALNYAYMFALVSLGPDRKGGYGFNGQLIKPCTGLGRDIENCNGDAVFLGEGDGLESNVPGPLFYDDIFVVHDLTLESDKWKYATTTGIRDKNNGLVGIGANDPAYPLDVAGNILVDKYDADNFCTADGTYCMPISALTSPGITCGTSGAAYGFYHNTLQCADAIDTTHLVAKTCPTGQYITGFDAVGTPTCASPTTP